MTTLVRRFIRDDAGQDMVEYSLLAAFISIIAYTVIVTIGEDVLSIYGTVDTATGLAAS